MAAKKDDSLKLITEKYGDATGASQALKAEQLEALAATADRAAFDTLLSSYGTGDPQQAAGGPSPELAERMKAGALPDPEAEAARKQGIADDLARERTAALADPDAETAEERAARLAMRAAGKNASSAHGAQKEPPEGWIQVQVGKGTAQNPVAEGASFIHPEGRVLITANAPAYVPDDNWTGENIARKILKRV